MKPTAYHIAWNGEQCDLNLIRTNALIQFGISCRNAAWIFTEDRPNQLAVPA